MKNKYRFLDGKQKYKKNISQIQLQNTKNNFNKTSTRKFHSNKNMPFNEPMFPMNNGPDIWIIIFASISGYIYSNCFLDKKDKKIK
jgi:hypothetical protein